MGTWRGEAADDTAWRCPPGLSPADRTAEQDNAAGGRGNRTIRLADGTALASVALRRKADGRRVYAYLRWWDHGGTVERYVGEVDQPSRGENLAHAWRLAAERRLADNTVPAANTASAEQDEASGAPTCWASTPAVREGGGGRGASPEGRGSAHADALGVHARGPGGDARQKRTRHPSGEGGQIRGP